MLRTVCLFFFSYELKHFHVLSSGTGKQADNLQHKLATDHFLHYLLSFWNILPADYLFYSYLYLIKFHSDDPLPHNSQPRSTKSNPIPSHRWWTTVFIHAQLLRRRRLIAVTASQYVFMSGPLLSSFKTSPAVIFSGSSNNSEHKDESRWTQVHVKAAGLRPPTTLLSLDVIVSTGGRPRWFKARLGTMRSLCPRCHSQRQPKLAARCDWKLARSPDWAKIPQVS